jgi:membrane protease YdiL (CAAX protease family)
MNERSLTKDRDMRGILWFLSITFALAWISWEIAIQSGVSVLDWRFQLFALPGAFAPAIAAIVVRKWITREGFEDAGLGVRLQHWPYYLLAWLLPLAVVAVIVGQSVLLGIAEPDFTLHRAEAVGVAGRHLEGVSDLGWLVIPQLMILAIVTTPVLWGEEFGWRGYLQRRIFVGRPVAAALVTGIIWAIWHFPLTLRGYDFPDRPLLGSLLLIIIAILLAYLFGWLREKSGSIWTASLAHASTNTIGQLSTLWLAGAAGPFVISYAGLLAILPLFLACAIIYCSERRPRLPHRQEQRQDAQSDDGDHRAGSQGIAGTLDQ